MIFRYWFTVVIITIFILLAILANYEIIFKNNKLGCFLRSSTFKFVYKRILSALFTLFLIITIVFVLIRIMPKDYFNSYTSNVIINNYQNSSLANNDNIFKQLFDYYYNILPFPKKVCTAFYLENNELYCNCYEYKIIDLGTSYTYMKNISVWSIIKEKCGVSFLIGILAFIIQCLIGYPLGIYLARKENKILDKSVNVLHIIIRSIPAILYFYLFVLLFLLVFKLPITFEINNYLTYIAPLSALSLWSSLTVAYWVKKYLLLEKDKDYVKLAMSKGLDERTIFYKHIMRNALIPLIRTIPTTLVLCLCGFYLLEASFNIPGIGLTLISAINLEDVYLVQGLILFFSFLSILAYLAGDLITILLDHRVNFTREGNINGK